MSEQKVTDGCTNKDDDLFKVDEHDVSHEQPEAPKFEHTVLIAVDASEHSERAFQAYAEKMHRPGNRVIVLNVVVPVCVSPVTGFGASTMWRFDNWGAESEQAWKQAHDKHFEASKKLQLEYAEKMKQRGLHGKVLLYYHDRPGEAIVEYASKKNVDLIVLGSRGLGKLRRTFTGSHSNYVINHANVPVTVVPPETR